MVPIDRGYIRDIVKLIEYFDGVRVGYGVDFKTIERILTNRKKIEEALPYKFKALKKDIEEMLLLIYKDKKATKALNRLRISLFLHRFVFFTLIFSLIALFLGIMFSPFLVFLMFPVLYIAVILKTRSLVTIRLFYINNREKLAPGKDRKIKETINSLINLIREIEWAKGYVTLRLYNTDYNNIKIVKRPGFFRDYFVAVVV